MSICHGSSCTQWFDGRGIHGDINNIGLHRFSVLSQDVGWEERLRTELFCVGLGRKTITQLIKKITSLT